MREHFWFVMEPSARTRDGAMPVMYFTCHDQAADWAIQFPDCWLEPGYCDWRDEEAWKRYNVG